MPAAMASRASIILPCPKCDGTGEFDGKKCPECDGTGEVPVGEGDDAKAKTTPTRFISDVNPAPERQRIAAILNAPEAEGREQLARTLALETDLEPEAARKILGAAPKAASATPPNPLAAQMAQIPNPKVGVRGEEAQDSAEAEAAHILAFVPQERRKKRA